jgi:HSP20 family protein
VTPWLTHLISLPFAPRAMPVEEFDDGGEHVVRVEMPGVDPSRLVRVVALDGVLCVRAELDRGSAANRIRLPERVDRDSITARYERGILEVRMSVAPNGVAHTIKVDA